MIIYRFENLTNGKVYIGQTTRSLHERTLEHKRKTKGLLGKAIRKYGLNNFNISIVYETECIDKLNLAESAWIIYEDCLTPKGYNIVSGGGNTKGYVHTDNTRAKMSKAKEGMYKGNENPFFGKRHSEETKAKMRGRVMSEENKAKLKASARVVPVLNITTGKSYKSIKEASEDTGILATNLSRVCRGGSKTAGGFQWKYI